MEITFDDFKKIDIRIGEVEEAEQIPESRNLLKLVVDFIFELNEKIGMPNKLHEVGVSSEHLDALTDLAVADFCHPNNPKPVTREDFKKIYTEAL